MLNISFFFFFFLLESKIENGRLRPRKWQGWDSKLKSWSLSLRAHATLRLHSWRLHLGGLGNMGEVRRMPMKWKMGCRQGSSDHDGQTGLSQQGQKPRSSGEVNTLKLCDSVLILLELRSRASASQSVAVTWGQVTCMVKEETYHLIPCIQCREPYEPITPNTQGAPTQPQLPPALPSHQPYSCLASISSSTLPHPEPHWSVSSVLPFPLGTVSA